MKVSIETIRGGLQTQLDELDRELQAAEAKVAGLKATRRQVANAIRAFGDHDVARAKPAPRKAQVRTAILDLLSDNKGVIEAGDLEALVAEKLATEAGCSAMGLALRMREVLASEEFVVADGLVRSLTK